MRKLLGVLFLSLAVSHSVLADTNIPWTKEGCESVKGTWITAHSPSDPGCDANHCNGLNFCRGPKGINWWSALIWCKSIGHRLADIETMCPNGLSSGMSCANLNGITTYVWSSTPSTAEKSYEYGHQNQNLIRGTDRWDVRTNTEHPALCTE